MVHCANSGWRMMGRKSAEVRLATGFSRAVQALPYPTIFGWHNRRDDELALMLHISANGLRLVPAHLAGNFVSQPGETTGYAGQPARCRHRSWTRKAPT